MTWPEWSNVLPSATVAVTVAGAVAGLLWTLAKLFRPMAVEVARDACDRLRADLEGNHFHDIRGRLDRMQVRFDERLDRMDRRAEERTARILEALRSHRPAEAENPDG